MTISAGLETLEFSFIGKQAAGLFNPVLVGVVGSGNLEVMLEAVAGDHCTVRVETSACGFKPIWLAVLNDFHERHPLGGIRISINDMGATPAVVSLRLDQAMADLPGAKK